MYQWYKKAGVCYAYLSDVEPFQPDNLKVGMMEASRWFKRGWTLQELIAPSTIEFYDASWSEIGTKSSISRLLSQITGIRLEVLRGQSLKSCNVAERMSWAAQRGTTRSEDMAYCLMGLFDVNMPLLYGEGEVRAFVRLQEEILRSNEDYTIFVWVSDNSSEPTGLFAPSVTCFQSFLLGSAGSHPRLVELSQIQPSDAYLGERSGVSSTEPPIMTSRGLRMTLHTRQTNLDTPNLIEVFLNCVTRMSTEDKDTDYVYELLCLKLCKTATHPISYERISPGSIAFCSESTSDTLAISLHGEKGTIKPFHLATLYAAHTSHTKTLTSQSLIQQTSFAYQYSFFRIQLGPRLNIIALSAEVFQNQPHLLKTQDFAGRCIINIILNTDSSDHLWSISAGAHIKKPWCHAELYTENLHPKPTAEDVQGDLVSFLTQRFTAFHEDLGGFASAFAAGCDDRARCFHSDLEFGGVQLGIKRCPKKVEGSETYILVIELL